MFVARRPSYSRDEAEAAISASFSWAEALRRLGLCPTGGAWRVLKKHAASWNIPTGHFLPHGRPPAARRSLEEILVPGSPVRGPKLKERLYRAGLKERACELCGQGESWRGRPMSLILDHVNGVRDDNRLENLRIVCPNCNATLETHCGRQLRIRRADRECARCGSTFAPRSDVQRYCSQRCGSRHDNRPRPAPRRVRPALADLLETVATAGYVAAGRRYGVSDNAIRKWIVAYGATPPRRQGQHRRTG